MKVINVYEQYFKGHCVYNGVERRGVLVMLTATSDEGAIRYEAALTFFPHMDPEDFAVSYDAHFSKELYFAPGRRSRKREEKLLEGFRAEADTLAAEAGGSIDWDAPLLDARYG